MLQQGTSWVICASEYQKKQKKIFQQGKSWVINPSEYQKKGKKNAPIGQKLSQRIYLLRILLSAEFL